MGEIKITRKLLDDYRKIKAQIPLLEIELREMRKGDNGIGSSTIFDYRTGQPRPQAVVGFDWALYERRKVLIKHKREQAAKVERWIDAIEDGQTRCIFRMHYVQGMSWVKIAGKLKMPGESTPRVCFRDSYLQKMGIL